MRCEMHPKFPTMYADFAKKTHKAQHDTVQQKLSGAHYCAGAAAESPKAQTA